MRQLHLLQLSRSPDVNPPQRGKGGRGSGKPPDSCPYGNEHPTKGITVETKEKIITNDQFDEALKAILKEQTVEHLLSIDGVYEILSEEFNNESIMRVMNEPEEKTEITKEALYDSLNSLVITARKFSDIAYGERWTQCDENTLENAFSIIKAVEHNGGI